MERRAEMLSEIETERLRDRIGRRYADLVRDLTASYISQFDFNNSAETKTERKNKDRSLPKKAKMKVEKKNKDAKKKKKEKTFTLVMKAETFTYTIEGETVIVNQVELDEEEDKKVHLNTPPRTPFNYSQTIDYFRHIKEARQTFFRAADCAWDLLLRGEVEGDAKGWEEFCVQKVEDVKIWRRKCEHSHKKRAQDTRKVEEGEESWLGIMKYGRMIKAWFWGQFVDIFPCCVPA